MMLIMSGSSSLLLLLVSLLVILLSCNGFLISHTPAIRRPPCLISQLASTRPGGDDDRQPRKTKTKKKSGVITLGELQDEIRRKPQLLVVQSSKASQGKSKSSTSRSRRRVEQPKQKYVYKAQRQLQQDVVAGTDSTTTTATVTVPSTDIQLATQYGLKATSQHCDPLMDTIEPVILGRIRVEEGEGSGSFAYLIEKPAGWAILGGKETSTTTMSTADVSEETVEVAPPASSKPKPFDRNKFKRQIKATGEDGSVDLVEFNELDILAVLSLEEREEYIEQYKLDPSILSFVDASLQSEDEEEGEDEEEEELEPITSSDSPKSERHLGPQTEENLKRIAARSEANKGKAVFADMTARRPSVVAWLKEFKQKQTGNNFRGGNFWVAAAGATEVDDSGIVLLCPRASVDNIVVEFADYVAVVGNGGNLQSVKQKDAVDGVVVDMIGKLRNGRGGDIVQGVKVRIPEETSTCSSVIGLCQGQFKDGIRGDFAANPLERRARRRLIHCDAMSISSLAFDENVRVSTPSLPNDIAYVTDRRPNQKYSNGSWLGRQELQQNPLTTAYREINGAADGFPGWTVDRYDRWLFVQHDPDYPKGPLPSIHDGYTVGVYYLEARQDRSAMGSLPDARPTLLEGRPAPDGLLPVLENGVTYLVSLDRDLSTGIFLDQRPNRAWLTRNCCEQTQILNCFAHTGAFSVAAASAGASTVNLDLSRKWLERLPEQLQANGIPFDEKHDCIYGDCFEWLAKLVKRKEKYDLVILDPPSTSVGGTKKKRWSVANDMDELVSLAARLVKRGGVLWTTTNSGRITSSKFARLCKRGLDEAGVEAKLERIQPLPVDFPSIGTPSVKNLVWRIVKTNVKK